MVNGRVGGHPVSPNVEGTPLRWAGVVKVGRPASRRACTKFGRPSSQAAQGVVNAWVAPPPWMTTTARREVAAPAARSTAWPERPKGPERAAEAFAAATRALASSTFAPVGAPVVFVFFTALSGVEGWNFEVHVA
jgi:hypothetical protein